MLNTVLPEAGGYRMKTNRLAAMAAYDRLPAIVRKALRETHFSFSAESAEDMINIWRFSPEDVARQIREDDARFLAESWRKRMGKS
jgi:nitrate/nitrite-specific signal transduction histidine kinase